MILKIYCLLASFLLIAQDDQLKIDLDGDTDQNGYFSLTKTEERAEADHPLIVLNNCDCDDDTRSKPDNTDTKINGIADREDLEPIAIRKNSGRTNEKICIRISNSENESSVDAAIKLTERFRIFDREGNEVLGPGKPLEYHLNAQELELIKDTDLLFLVEGLRFRTTATLSVLVDGTETDQIMLQTAPFILTPNNLRPTQNIAVNTKHASIKFDSQKYLDVFDKICHDSGVETPHLKDQKGDLWIEDEFCWGYTETPRHQMHVVLHMHRQRSFGVYTGLAKKVSKLLGPDVGYFRAFDYPIKSTSLDNGGNVEVTPPVPGHPFGRVYFGGTKSTSDGSVRYFERAIHQGFQDFFERQRVQAPINLNTDWLRVGHVDEIVTFLTKKNGQVVMLLASPALGIETLKQAAEPRLHHYYYTSYKVRDRDELFDLRYLGSRSIESFNQQIDRKIFGIDRQQPSSESIKGIFMDSLGLKEADVREVPVIFMNHKPMDDRDRFSAVSLTPCLVNLSCMSRNLIVPDPFIPEFRAAFELAVQDTSYDVNWIDDWWLYHTNLGEVHCGSIEKRVFFNTKWWQVEGN